MVQIKDIITYLKQGHNTIENTVDELLFGDENQEVHKIATTFNASIAVINKAIEEGVQLLISHEGIYYSHRGQPEGLDEHDVYKQKHALITSNHLALFRYHDYIHLCFPDPITAGLVEQLQWHAGTVEHQPYSAVVTLANEDTVKNIAAHIKDKLKLDFVRVTGQLETPVKKVGILVGFRGGAANALPLIHQYDLELLIVGEAQEWETAEYIADCQALGLNKAMITIGHMPSEAYGMKQLADKLEQYFPEVSVLFIENIYCYQTI